LMLLAAALLMYRGFQQTMTFGTGFAKDHLLMVRLDPRLVQYDAEATRRFYELLIARAREISGVERATLTRHPPLALYDVDALEFVPDGYQMPRDRASFTSGMDTVDD